jgi:hypothetical protein
MQGKNKRWSARQEAVTDWRGYQMRMTSENSHNNEMSKYQLE